MDFADTWTNLLLYTSNYKLDAKAYMDLLQLVVQGSAKKVLYDMVQAGKSLTTIVESLGHLYAERRTIIHDMNDLNAFTRKSKESIYTAMQRATVLAERIRHMWPADVWITCKRTEVLKAILYQVITQDTREYLSGKLLEYWKAGTNLEFSAILDLVETYEQAHKQIPTTEQT